MCCGLLDLEFGLLWLCMLYYQVLCSLVGTNLSHHMSWLCVEPEALTLQGIDRNSLFGSIAVMEWILVSLAGKEQEFLVQKERSTPSKRKGNLVPTTQEFALETWCVVCLRVLID